MPPLDLLHTPLSGRHLIEAAAGTGKTYAITALYTRLVIEDGRRPDDLLVVTYTEAACAELKDRVRARLAEMAAALGGDSVADAFATDLAARYRGRQEDLRTAADRLTLALMDLDRSAIFTIHGFCRRVLAESAFDCGFPFETEFVEDDRSLLGEVIDDYWRRQAPCWHPVLAASFLHAGLTPAALLGPMREITGVLRAHGPGALAFPALVPPGDFDPAPIERALDLWRRDGAAIRDLLDNSDALKRNDKAYRQDVLDGYYQALAAWERGEVRTGLIVAIGALTPEKLAAAEMKRHDDPLPQHPFFSACAEIMAALEAARHGLLHALALECFSELPRRKEAAGVISFDDLLTGVRDALRQPESGPSLARWIAARYPVALIDEFQDTDPVQFEIFDRVYGPGGGKALFMVGDPKQAIYGFRGADVFSYLTAAAGPGMRLHTLDTNWRSVPGLVRAVNDLFSRPEPFALKDISYHPIAPCPRPGRVLTGKAAPAAPLVLHCFADQSRADAREAAARETARLVRNLLAAAKRGEVMLGGEGRPLSAGDIAVLVRGHRQGEMVRRALGALGIYPAVKSRQVVWESAEAAQLAAIMRAVAAPADTVALRGALCTTMLGSGVLLFDDAQCDAAAGRFAGYLTTWRSAGPAAMLFRLLEEEGVWTRLAALEGGERALTNTRHLIELLQEAAGSGDLSPEGLVTWFGRRLHDPGTDEEAILRLESDSALVQIVTIHASKGLQYPVVFCPFPWETPTRSKNEPLFARCHEQGGVVADFGTDAYGRRLAAEENEAFSEEMRLLYVALTRAESACYVFWGRVKNRNRILPCEHSPLGYLLSHALGAGPLGELDSEDHRQRLAAWSAATAGTVQVRDFDDGPPPARLAPAVTAPNLSPPPVSRRRLNPWLGVRSFSSLHQGGAEPLAAADNDEVQVGSTAPLREAAAEGIFAFPRGPGAGSCLHAIFERLDFQEQDPEVIAALVAEQLALYGIDPAWNTVVCELLAETTHTALADAGPTLAAIPRSQRLDELEFYYTVPGLGDDELRALFAAPGASRPLSAAPSPTAFMKGFIDLVFEWQGRFYIVDYKSNHLGDTLADYAPGRLAGAMTAAGYDLQYHIYTVALHRYLGRRLPGYEYERHFGGIFYLFLRGLRREQGPAYGVYAARPSWDRVAALDACLTTAGGGA